MRGSNNACVVTAFPGSRENSIVTPLNFRTPEALVEEGEPEGGWWCFLEAKAPSSHAGEVLSTLSAAASNAGDTRPGDGQSLPFVSS